MRGLGRSCNNLPVRTRALLVTTLCLAVLATRTLGVHAHMSPGEGLAGHPHDSDHQEHRQSLVVTTSVEGGAHVDAHLVHGEIDLNYPAVAPGKASLLELTPPVVLSVDTASVWLVPTTGIVAPPPYRPPRYRPRTHLLPPAQAPPFAA